MSTDGMTSGEAPEAAVPVIPGSECVAARGDRFSGRLGTGRAQTGGSVSPTPFGRAPEGAVRPLSRHGGESHMACARAWPRSRSLRRSPRSLVSDVGIPGLHVRLVGADAIAPSPPSAPVPNRGYHAPPPPGLPLPPLYASPRRVDGWDDVGGM